MIPLKMPGLYQEITIKIIDLPYEKGEDVFVKVVMFGDPKKFEFEMKISKTIWFSIEDHLMSMENDPLNAFMNDSAFKTDEELSYLKGRAITIKAISDKSSKGFMGKDGIIGYPKIFTVDFRYDLEEVERLGGDEYTAAVFKFVINEYSCKECRIANTNAAKNDLIKKENKEKEKEEKKKKDWDESTVDWVVKKREVDKKEDKRQKKFGDSCGW